MFPYTERAIRLPHLSIQAKFWGNPTHPPLLALHGWLDNAGTFDELAPLLTEHYYVIALDLPGQGFSDPLPPGASYHLFDAMGHLQAITSVLKLEQFTLLGHSLGAIIALLYASAASEHVSALLLIDALGPVSSPEETASLQLNRYLKNLNTTSLGANQYTNLNDAIQSRLRQNPISLKAATLLATRGVSCVGKNYFWNHDRRLLNPANQPWTETQVLHLLRALSMPVCLIEAEEGFLTNQSYLQKRLEAVPHLTHHKLLGNHHLHLDDPHSVANRFLEFLKTPGTIL